MAVAGACGHCAGLHAGCGGFALHEALWWRVFGVSDPHVVHFPRLPSSWLSSINFACNFPEQSCLFASVRIAVSLVFWNCMRLCGASTCALRSLRCPASGICAFWIGSCVLDRLFSIQKPITYPDRRFLSSSLAWQTLVGCNSPVDRGGAAADPHALQFTDEWRQAAVVPTMQVARANNVHNGPSGQNTGARQAYCPTRPGLVVTRR